MNRRTLPDPFDKTQDGLRVFSRHRYWRTAQAPHKCLATGTMAFAILFLVGLPKNEVNALKCSYLSRMKKDFNFNSTTFSILEK